MLYMTNCIFNHIQKKEYKSQCKHFLVMLFLAIIAYASILRSPLFYTDDALRVFTHTSINQGVHGRPLADVIYSLLSAGLFVDISPLSQIFALSCLIASGMLVTHAFIDTANEEKAFTKWLPLLFTVLPLHTALILYRYDSPSMCLAIFCSSLAFFVTYKKTTKLRMCFSGILLFAVLALYQPMIGTYMCICCIFFAHSIIREPFGKSINRGMQQIFSLIVGGILYIPVYVQARYASAYEFCGLPNHPYVFPNSKLLSHNILQSTIQKLYVFTETADSYLGRDITSICIIFIILLLLLSILKIALPLARKSIVLLSIIISFYTCGISCFVLHETAIGTRILSPLCMFILCILCLIICNYKSIYKLIVVISCVMIINSSSIITSIGNAHRDQWLFEKMMILQPLTEDFSTLLQKNGKFSYTIRNHVPDHYTMKKLKKNYSYVASTTTNFFMITYFMSYLSITFDINAFIHDMNAPSIESFPVIVQRLTYDICHDIDKNNYIVVLKNDYLPESVISYESKAPLFFMK